MTGVPAANSGTYCVVAVPLAAASGLEAEEETDDDEFADAEADATGVLAAPEAELAEPELVAEDVPSLLLALLWLPPPHPTRRIAKP